MPDFIRNITGAANAVYISGLGLFTVVALIAIGVILAVAFFAPEVKRAAWVGKLVTALAICAVFGATSALITWALGIG